MLPRYLDLDMAEVCRDLQEAGLPIEAQWFTCTVISACPARSFVKDGVRVRLRQAIEPWHVLGEEATAGGQSRYVDSSCERMEVLVRGLSDRRHSILCNGYELPLRPTGIEGEMVAAVRYRAWQPPSCLHPTVPIDSPLTFDLYDTWNDRAIAGATYHVMHPGGRAFETRPINANEAEGRRCLRFQAEHRPANKQPSSYRSVPRHR